MADNRSKIEKLAHDLWVKRGRPVGDPMTDWLQAEKIIASQQQTAAPAQRAPMIQSATVSQSARPPQRRGR
jgi:hypothetical protein